MSHIVLHDPVRCGDWLYERLNVAYSPKDSYAIGLEAHGELVAGVLYKDFTGRSVVMHTAVDDPAAITKRFIWLVFDYPFNQMGVEQVIGYVNSSNIQALNLDFKLGFKLQAVIPDVYENGDMFLLTMRREDCRWLRLGERYEQEKQTATAA